MFLVNVTKAEDKAGKVAQAFRLDKASKITVRELGDGTDAKLVILAAEDASIELKAPACATVAKVLSAIGYLEFNGPPGGPYNLCYLEDFHKLLELSSD